MGLVASVNNSVIGFEETINNATSGIMTQQKRQHDLILQLVQAVEASSEYESKVQTDIAKLRTVTESGDIQQANMVLKAIAEAYPQLMAVSNYKDLMTEMSISENLVTQYRNTYNDNVETYKKYVRRFPSNAILGLIGYTQKEYRYLEFKEADITLPEKLF
jgi:LemA protein